MGFYSGRLPSIIVCIAVFFLMIVRVIYFYNAPDPILISVVPDDAFYYMQLAKNWSSMGFWTFDGSSSTTGFHFLYAYFLAFIYSIFGNLDWRHLYIIIGVLASIFISLSAYLVSRSADMLFGHQSILFAIAPFFTIVAINQSTVMMESWLVLFFSAATIYVLVKDARPSFIEGLSLLILGIMGSLSRTDFGMLPGVMFVVLLATHPILKNNGLKRSGIVLAGAVIGVAVVLLQNLYISGHLAQASAQTKFYWSSVMGHNISVPIDLVRSIAMPFYGVLSSWFKIVLILCAVFSVYYSWRGSMQVKDLKKYFPALALTSGCLLTVFAYIDFYKFNSGSLQIWYSSNFIAPIGISMAAAGFVLFKRSLLVPSILVFIPYAAICITNIFSVSWPHAAGMMNAGLFLKQNNYPGLYGSWNAGIISYFSGSRIVNIDGLTNDEVLPYIKSNNLFDYIKAKNIDYLVDYQLMLTSRVLRKRGGYFDERIDRCVSPIQAIDGNSPNWYGSRLFIFKVIPGCG